MSNVAIQASNPDPGRTRQSPACLDALEFKIVSLNGQSALMAVSGSVDPLADPAPDASVSSG